MSSEERKPTDEELTILRDIALKNLLSRAFNGDIPPRNYHVEPWPDQFNATVLPQKR